MLLKEVLILIADQLMKHTPIFHVVAIDYGVGIIKSCIVLADKQAA